MLEARFSLGAFEGTRAVRPGPLYGCRQSALMRLAAREAGQVQLVESIGRGQRGVLAWRMRRAVRRTGVSGLGGCNRQLWERTLLRAGGHPRLGQDPVDGRVLEDERGAGERVDVGDAGLRLAVGAPGELFGRELDERAREARPGLPLRLGHLLAGKVVLVELLHLVVVARLVRSDLDLKVVVRVVRRTRAAVLVRGRCATLGLLVPRLVYRVDDLWRAERQKRAPSG